MASREKKYQTQPFPAWRNMAGDLCDLGRRQNTIHGFVEVDVTVPRTLLREHKARTGESLSFTGFVTLCLAQAVAQDRQVQALRQGRKLVIFDDVDVTLMVEGEVDGRKVVVNHIVRQAQLKSVRQIHDEIRAAQAGVHEKARRLSAFTLFLSLPRFIRSRMFQLIRSRATLWAGLGGTVSITAVGMFGSGRAGWGLPISPAPLMLTVGGIAKKPAVVDDRIEPREILCLTISLDHDTVDGAPAARFVSRLTELLESGYGLNGDLYDPEPVPDSSLAHPPGRHSWETAGG